MLWKDIGYLCNEGQILDKLQRPRKTYTERLIYCDIKSIRQSEFYQAKSDGFKPEIMAVIKSFEYENENHFKYNDTLYRIVRTYDRGEKMELICTSMVIKNE